MKKILVPTDFSACANAAAELAIKVAQYIRAELYYLNLCREPLGVTHIPGQYKELPSDEIKFARTQLAQLVSMTERQGVKATPILVFDNGVEKIEDYVEPYGVELIVMGSHGAAGIKEFVLGSNTQRIIKDVHVPVLVVKNSTDLGTIKNILFASDFDFIPIDEFKIVATLARAVKATVNLVFVNYIDDYQPAEIAQDKMEQLADAYPEISFNYNIAETNDEEFAITQFANQLNADLIAITVRDKSANSKFLSLSDAEHLANHEKHPVLVVRH